ETHLERQTPGGRHSLAIERDSRGFTHFAEIELPCVGTLRGRIELHAVSRGTRKALCLGVIERGPARKRAHARRIRQHRPALDELETPLAPQRDARGGGPRVVPGLCPVAVLREPGAYQRGFSGLEL